MKKLLSVIIMGAVLSVPTSSSTLDAGHYTVNCVQRTVNIVRSRTVTRTRYVLRPRLCTVVKIKVK